MPRRKVEPENRIRAVQACATCRASKKRCDGRQPCSLCIHKGRQESCTFESRPDGGHLSTLSAADSEEINEEDIVGEARHRLLPRHLSNAQGERVFVGPSASLAFLQFIRELVAKSTGASEFTESPQTTRMLEVSQNSYDNSGPVELDDTTKLRFGHNFLIVTAGLIDYIDESSLQRLLFHDHIDLRVSAICELILAIGAQASCASSIQAKVESQCLASAQVTAFSDLLENPSRTTVEIFLLLAFYMIQACQRNAAYMYIGVAIRAAHVVGLAEESRLWTSLVNLDIIVGSILGRATTTLKADEGKVRTVTSAGDASYQMSVLVFDIINTLYQSPSVTIKSARAQIERLEKWTAALPHNLRIDAVPNTHDFEVYKHITGCLNISCYYHFAVILCCRPFLISHLLTEMLKQRDAPGSRSNTIQNTERRQLADKCVTAATYMAQTCEEVLDAGYMIDSAPILKAWIFAAGLVLGLQMFALDDVDFSVESALKSSRRVLQKLAPRSSQASHYYDILNHLHSAIQTKRQQLQQSNHRAAPRNVEKLIDLSGARKMSFHIAPDSQDGIEPGPWIDLDGLDTVLDNVDHSMLDSELFMGWDQAAWQF